MPQPEPYSVKNFVGFLAFLTAIVAWSAATWIVYDEGYTRWAVVMLLFMAVTALAYAEVLLTKTEVTEDG